MTGYKNVYKGDTYLTYIKFSYALNITFVAMMYGIGMPILFPLAAVVLIVQWVCERMTLAKDVVLPPAMGDSMINKSLNIL